VSLIHPRRSSPTAGLGRHSCASVRVIESDKIRISPPRSGLPTVVGVSFCFGPDTDERRVKRHWAGDVNFAVVSFPGPAAHVTVRWPSPLRSRSEAGVDEGTVDRRGQEAAGMTLKTWLKSSPSGGLLCQVSIGAPGE
jgi:hypothetical protein